jgi:peptidoglycan/xylan/chitin deacetylase (PgdA/CDA1 family)
VASNVAVQIGGQGVDSSGNEITNSWSTIANVAANNTGSTVKTWTVTTGGFTAPAGAAYEEVLVPLAAVGWTATDDYTMTSVNAPAAFSSGMVTVALDDGWASEYSNALPILQADKLPATFYIIGSEIGDTPDYMTAAQIKQLVTDGDEIGNHTWDHPDNPALATFTSTQIQQEFQKAQTAIQQQIGVTPTTCAYPDGSYNATVLQVAQSFGFKACRSVDTTTDTYGANTPGMLAIADQYNLHLMDVNVDVTTPPSEIEAAIDYAKANNVWVILTYHAVTADGTYPGGDQYASKTADFQTEMNYLASSGVPVKTLASAYAWAAAQIPSP